MVWSSAAPAVVDVGRRYRCWTRLAGCWPSSPPSRRPSAKKIRHPSRRRYQQMTSTNWTALPATLDDGLATTWPATSPSTRQQPSSYGGQSFCDFNSNFPTIFLLLFLSFFLQISGSNFSEFLLFSSSTSRWTAPLKNTLGGGCSINIVIRGETDYVYQKPGSPASSRSENQLARFWNRGERYS